MPNVSSQAIICDLVHEIQVHFEAFARNHPVWKDVHYHFFKRPRASVMFLKYSDKSQARLCVVQVEFIGKFGLSVSGLKKILNDFSWAPHRFDSESYF